MAPATPLPAPTFCPPYCAASSLLSAARRTTAATLAALALTLTPPARAASAPAVLPVSSPPSLSLATARAPASAASAVVVFDKDYVAPPPLDLSASASPAFPALPPRPSASAELRILIRLLVALVVGGFIGMERRAANSLAGVRTFSLVSLGAAIFMTTTLVAFPAADPARVAAAISSSVGFLGAGAMHKNAKHHRGLTTASSVWLAAALGIAAASGLFLLSFAGAVSTVLIARYARFDSSLQLIRGDPLMGDDESDENRLGERYNLQRRRRAGFEYAASNGAYAERSKNGYSYEAGNGVRHADSIQLQALVDYDPSSQGTREADDDDCDPGNGAADIA